MDLPRMKLLALDTSTEACSVALYLDGAIQQLYQFAPQKHAELILPMCEQLLAEAGLSLGVLDAIAFARGPGSFTGVRIGAGVAQGIAFGRDLPLLPISSLAALAQGMYRERGSHNVLAAIDARMAQVYWAPFSIMSGGTMTAMGEERVDHPALVSTPSAESWAGAGSGWSSYADQMIVAKLVLTDGNRFPQAQDVALLAAHDFALGRGLAAELGLPVYVRDDVAKKSVVVP